MGRRPKPAKSKVGAKRSISPKPPKGAGAKVRDLEKRLVEAQEQQTATSDILRVISESPTDVRPVFEVIAAHACRLCDGVFANVIRFDGTLMHNMAENGFTAEAREFLRRAFPSPPSRSSMSGRAILAATVVYVEDVTHDMEPGVSREMGGRTGHRAMVSVPMLHNGAPVGAITVARLAAGRFAERQVNLLKTFADQAVIAIENVRLFNETKEALERQTATSEILRVISSSPTDAQPVFDAIARNAARLCDASRSSVNLLEGDWIRFVARYNLPEGWTQIHVADAPNATRVIRDGVIFHVADAETDTRVTPEALSRIRALGSRSFLMVPLHQEITPIGSIVVYRSEAGSFSDQQIELLKTFADQAVIAIENVRLFKELEASNRELTTTLDKQTATSEILRVISQSQTDVQPVFDAIVRNAVRLCGASNGGVYRVDGEMVHSVAHDGYTPEQLQQWQATWPKPVSAPSVACQAIRTRGPIRVRDFEAVSESHTPETRANMRFRGSRSILAVPMFRQNAVMGAISLAHRDVDAFSDAHVELLKTFADQAIIAIENARLFHEIEDKSRQLEAASQHKSEFLANMSHELRTPLNAIIGFSEVLSEKMFGELNEKQEEYSKDIHASGQHLLSLINDILDLSKIEAGRMELELTDFHLPTALDSALTLVRERAGRRSIALHLSVDEQLGQMRADERKVRQVVLNLLSNAIKFTPEGGRIEVAAVLRDGLAEVSVSDTGIGIAPEDQEQVFEEFRQVGTADKKAEGTGLGLTLCRKFIELHGGKIWVKSQVRVGSTFTFTIPVGNESQR